jgi:hypothetical protein
MTTTGTVGLSKRIFSDEDMDTLRSISEKHKFSYSIFCAVIVHDVLSNEELTEKYIAKTRQFEEDQAPATIEEMKELRAQLRRQEEELEQLRAFKESAKSSLNDAKAVNAYR